MAVLSRRERTAHTRRTTEQALATAAIALLDEGAAFADLGIEQIVRRAGLSRPTFYAYFADKRALILHLGAAMERDLVATADPWLSFADVPLRDTLAAVLDVFRTHRAVVGAVIEASTYDPQVADWWRTFHERFMPGARKRIAAAHPELPRGDVAARAYALIWMTERTLIEHVARPTVSERALLDQMAFIWRASA